MHITHRWLDYGYDGLIQMIIGLHSTLLMGHPSIPNNMTAETDLFMSKERPVQPWVEVLVVGGRVVLSTRFSSKYLTRNCFSE